MLFFRLTPNFDENWLRMTRKTIPELSFLLTEVEKKYGRKLSTATDFESLSVVIEMTTRAYISASTLKRLWGYVTMNPTPRISTLDILCKFIGHKDFKSFCTSLKDTSSFNSTFFTSRCMDTSDLGTGDIVRIGWAPDREVKMEYHGEHRFRVTESANSKLLPGDEFEITHIMLEYPLYISRILRDGNYTPPYVAGMNGGILTIRIEK